MAVEEGFIQYTVDVKGADQVRREFDALSDAARATGKGFDQLDKFLAENEKRWPRVTARLRESAKALREYHDTSRKAEGANASKSIDERRQAYEREQQQISLLSDELERMTQRRKLDKELEGNLGKANKATDRNENQKIADTANKEAAARDRVTKAIQEQAKAKAALDATGDPRKGAVDAARYDQANTALKRYTESTNELTAAQQNLSRVSEQSTVGLAVQRHAYDDMGRMYRRTGAVLVGVGIAATVMASQFEASFANVERTLDPAEFGGADDLRDSIDNIRNSLVQMTGQLPLTFAELSEIATIGNQMGIAEADLMDFTSTIARFASVSGMSIEEVSKSFGGFMAQTGLAPQYLENLGSSLAYVSIKSNATETQILSVSREIAALSSGSGLAADQIVGLAGTLAALQVPAERARGSLTTYFQTLRMAVANGGTDLENFATVVGVSADELDRMVRAGKGADILEGFLTNLNKEDAIGVTQALDALGLAQLRVGNTFDRMSQNVDTFRSHMEYAQSAFIEGAELNRQYEVTLDTLNSQWTIFINGINALVEAISGGAVSSLGELFEVVNMVLFGLVDLLNRNPWASKIGLITFAILGATGAFLIFRGAVMGVRAALLGYAIINQAAARSAGVASLTNRSLIASMIGVRGAGGAAAAGAGQAAAGFNTMTASAQRAAIAMRVLRLALIGTGVGIAIAGLGFLAEKITGAGSSARDASLSMEQYNDMLNKANANAGGAGDGAESLADKLAGSGGGGGSPSVADAAEEAAQKLRLLTDYASDLAGVFNRSFSLRFDSGTAMDQVITKWNKLREEAEKYQQEINKLTADRSLREYWLGVAEMYDDQLRAGQLRAEIADIDRDLAKAQAGASTELRGNTQDAVDNRATMRDLLKGYQDYLEALAASGASQAFIQQEARRLNQEFMDQATALGFSINELGAYSVAFNDMVTVVSGMPREVSLEFNGDPALQALAEFNAKLAEEAARGGAAAGGAAGGGFDDALGGALDNIDYDSLMDPFLSEIGSGLEEAKFSWDAFWWDIGHGAIVAAATVAGTFVGLLGGIDSLIRTGDFMSGWYEASEKANTDIRQAFGSMGFFASDAMNTEFKAGLENGQWDVAVDGALTGVSYKFDAFTQTMKLNGAITAEEWTAAFGDNLNPTDEMIAAAGYAKDPLTNELYKVAADGSRAFNLGLGDNIIPGPVIADGVNSGKEDVKSSLNTVGVYGTTGFKDGLGSGMTPGLWIAQGMLSNNEQNKVKNAASSTGTTAGNTLWSAAQNALTGFGSWLAGLFNVNVSTTSSGSVRGTSGGRSHGGYTGAGYWKTPAGVVHKGEYVVPKKHVDQRSGLPRVDYVESLRRGKPAPRGSGGIGYAGGGHVGGNGTFELGEYSLSRIARDVSVSLRVDKQELASAASGGDARLARRGSN